MLELTFGSFIGDEDSCPMETVSVSELRRHTRRVIRQVQRGRCLVRTYRGRPVMRLEPYWKNETLENDPFYRLG